MQLGYIPKSRSIHIDFDPSRICKVEITLSDGKHHFLNEEDIRTLIQVIRGWEYTVQHSTKRY